MSPHLVNPDRPSRLDAAEGRPPARKKAVRAAWAGDRFGVVARHLRGGGDEAKLVFLAAMCR